MLERIRAAAEQRDCARKELIAALIAMEKIKTSEVTWREIGNAAGMTAQGVIAILRRAPR